MLASVEMDEKGLDQDQLEDTDGPVILINNALGLPDVLARFRNLLMDITVGAV